MVLSVSACDSRGKGLGVGVKGWGFGGSGLVTVGIIPRFTYN